MHVHQLQDVWIKTQYIASFKQDNDDSTTKEPQTA